MFIALVAAAPSLALLTYFYLRDRYEREPIGHVVAGYGLGMFALAAAQGMKEAVRNRDIIAGKMTVKQIGEAQRLARAWKPKSAPGTR